jgi:hypothetical protein
MPRDVGTGGCYECPCFGRKTTALAFCQVSGSRDSDLEFQVRKRSTTSPIHSRISPSLASATIGADDPSKIHHLAKENEVVSLGAVKATTARQ